MNENVQDSDFQENDYNINADENVSGTEHLTDPLEEEPKQQALETELQESRDKYMRLAAEFDNFRKRTARERVELFQTAGKDIIVNLLEVLDDMDRALPLVEKSKDKAMKEGLLLVFNKLKNILQSKGLKPMDALHKEFNPDLYDAVTEIQAPSDDLKGKVVDVLTKGYYLNDKIVRHAKVVVGK